MVTHRKDQKSAEINSSNQKMALISKINTVQLITQFIVILKGKKYISMCKVPIDSICI